MPSTNGGLNVILEQLREILNSLYVKYGLTSEVVRLSGVIDKLINQEQQRKALRIENMKYLEECYKNMSKGELIDIYEN